MGKYNAKKSTGVVIASESVLKPKIRLKKIVWWDEEMEGDGVEVYSGTIKGMEIFFIRSTHYTNEKQHGKYKLVFNLDSEQDTYGNSIIECKLKAEKVLEKFIKSFLRG